MGLFDLNSSDACFNVWWLMAKPVKLLGLIGVLAGLLGVALSVYMLLREATAISLTRDIVGSIAMSQADRELLLSWINWLGSGWSFAITCFLALDLLLVLLSAIVLAVGLRRGL
ncbi:MAG: hypothetical protein DRJ68_03685 [Thermoprotei archaeon]|nr:MAG: hypothetical protein DRJ68_03685 [Thermoprotei archaeon]